jgi:oligopeptide/dipeptide ABC transporter ATP-binding protein
MSLLQVRNLCTTFYTPEGVVRAVNDVSFAIEEGEMVGLVGESGSGKSVLALSIMRLVPPPGRIEGGQVLFKGRDLLQLSETAMRQVRGGEIGMIFQDPMTSLNPVLPVAEQVAETIRLHQPTGEGTGLLAELRRKYLPLSRPERSPSWQKAVSMLEFVGIPDARARARQYPHQFSGGMRQRVMIAMALACQPALLIADEPTTALDVTIQAQVLDELLRLKRQLGMAVLLITHDLAVVAETCDRVVVMYAGKIMEDAPSARLFSNPQHPYTQGLLASVPDVEDERPWLQTIEGEVPDLIGWERGCLFAPRCGEVEGTCWEADPKMVAVGPDHHVRCVRRRSPR